MVGFTTASLKMEKRSEIQQYLIKLAPAGMLIE
jgi:hypothetical protein